MSDLTKMGILETVHDNEYKGRPPNPFQARCVICSWQSPAHKSLKAAQNAFQAHYGEAHGDQPDVSD
jgi:hypothetical protein